MNMTLNRDNICNLNFAGSIGMNAAEAGFSFEEREKNRRHKKDMSYRHRRSKSHWRKDK